MRNVCVCACAGGRDICKRSWDQWTNFRRWKERQVVAQRCGPMPDMETSRPGVCCTNLKSMFSYIGWLAIDAMQYASLRIRSIWATLPKRPKLSCHLGLAQNLSPFIRLSLWGRGYQAEKLKVSRSVHSAPAFSSRVYLLYQVRRVHFLYSCLDHAVFAWKKEKVPSLAGIPESRQYCLLKLVLECHVWLV